VKRSLHDDDNDDVIGVNSEAETRSGDVALGACLSGGSGVMVHAPGGSGVVIAV